MNDLIIGLPLFAFVVVVLRGRVDRVDLSLNRVVVDLQPIHFIGDLIRFVISIVGCIIVEPCKRSIMLELRSDCSILEVTGQFNIMLSSWIK